MSPAPVLAAALLALAAPAAAQDVIAIESRALTFAPSRADVTVGKAVLTLYCSRPSEVRLDGAAPADVWTYRELARVDANRFALPAVRIELPAGHAGVVAVSVKVWFEQVDNQLDSIYYARPDDRYALVSFSTRTDGPEWERARPRFEQNRVATLEALRAALERPLRIPLTDRPLPAR